MLPDDPLGASTASINDFAVLVELLRVVNDEPLRDAIAVVVWPTCKELTVT